MLREPIFQGLLLMLLSLLQCLAGPLCQYLKVNDCVRISSPEPRGWACPQQPQVTIRNKATPSNSLPLHEVLQHRPEEDGKDCWIMEDNCSLPTQSVEVSWNSIAHSQLSNLFAEASLVHGSGSYGSAILYTISSCVMGKKETYKFLKWKSMKYSPPYDIYFSGSRKMCKQCAWKCVWFFLIFYLDTARVHL